MKKRITLTLASLVFGSALLIGQVTLTAHVYWPDGGSYLAPGDMLVRMVDPSNGNLLGAVEAPVENGKATVNNITNPLIEMQMEVSISADLNPRDGVSVLDMIRIQKHLLGLQPLNTALKTYAADANNSMSVSALDLVEIRKVILGYYTQWPMKPSVSFFERNTNDPPPVGSELKDTIVIPYSVIQAGQPINVQFWAVKTGDIR